MVNSKSLIASVILLLIATIIFFSGLSAAGEAAEKRNTDVSNISVTVTDQHYDASSEKLSFTYVIKNNTNKRWESLTIETGVYDRGGSKIWTINSNDIGVDLQPHGVAKKTVSVDVSREEWNGSVGIENMRFSARVTHGYYYN